MGAAGLGVSGAPSTGALCASGVAKVRALRPVEELVRIVRDAAEPQDGDAVEFAVDDMRAWAQNEEHAVEAADAGFLEALFSLMQRSPFREDELIIRTCLRTTLQFCYWGDTAERMRQAGHLALVDGVIAADWEAKDDMITVIRVIENTAKGTLERLAIKRMSLNKRKLTEAKVLRTLQTGLHSPLVAQAALEALAKLAIGSDALSLANADSLEALLPTLSEVQKLHGASVPVMARFSDAVCDWAASQHDGHARTALARAGLLVSSKAYLKSLLDDNLTGTLVQLCLFVLSELCRDHADNRVAFLLGDGPAGAQLLATVTERASGGAFTDGVVVPLALRELVRQRTAVLDGMADAREQEREVLAWRRKHFEAPVVPQPPRGAEAERAAFRAEGLFPDLPLPAWREAIRRRGTAAETESDFFEAAAAAAAASSQQAASARVSAGAAGAPRGGRPAEPRTSAAGQAAQDQPQPCSLAPPVSP
ncbi:hypothetical protein FNF31_02082 [Cafeteria roenbergensis]|uniref:Uncharacterized protein n=1 Tax=Cafeteria roenbergensis TaxID=33653 RepID=A0A5A8DIW2_CAFRO|nr:hypothetical protein FNF31_02082 [Cafeteria roenbergensis]